MPKNILLSHLFVFLNFAFAVTFMFGIGLRAESPEALYRGVDRRVIYRALLANVVLVPTVAWVIHRLVPMPHELALGFMLIAITPGGLFGIHFCHISKGNINLAVQLAFMLALAAILMVPLIAAVLFPPNVSSRFLDLRILVEVCVYALLPLILGLTVRRLWLPGAKILGKILMILNPLLFMGQEMVGSKVKDLSMHLVGHEILLAFGLLILACWAIGWVLGGPGIGRRKVLAIDTSMRNGAICWLLVHRGFADVDAAVAILAFNGMAVPMNFCFAMLTRFLFKDHESKK